MIKYAFSGEDSESLAGGIFDEYLFWADWEEESAEFAHYMHSAARAHRNRCFRSALAIMDCGECSTTRCRVAGTIELCNHVAHNHLFYNHLAKTTQVATISF